MEIEKLARQNIQELQQYSSARNEFSAKGYILLDANENNFLQDYNRYPEPDPLPLRQELAKLKAIKPENILLGNGSGELIDMVFRCFCEPQKDEALTIYPTFGMYEVCAKTQNVKLNKVSLDNEFKLNLNNFCKAINPQTKLIILCSPNNPTGNAFAKEDLLQIASSFNGIVLVDEAYIDFCVEKSVLKEIGSFPNLIVLQTFSKAWGMAGLRLGAAYANSEIISLLRKIKMPYNVNSLTQQLALKEIINPAGTQNITKYINKEKQKLLTSLQRLSFIIKVFPSDANFLLIEIADAEKLYEYLKAQKIIVRKLKLADKPNRFLRISIGNVDENKQLINALKSYSYE